MTQTTPEQRQRLRELHTKVLDGQPIRYVTPEERDPLFASPNRDEHDELFDQLTVESVNAVPALLAELDAAEAEIERLREEAVELHETILLAEGFMVRDGEMAGWIDSCCMTDVVISGDRLVELGIYERHPNRAGRRSFYRRKDAQSRTALESKP